MKNPSYLLPLLLLQLGCATEEPIIEDKTLTDIDGNVYETIQIGEQVWMASNLKVTYFADGSAIPLVEDYSEWDALKNSDKAYCYYRNEISKWNTYGGLYTWAAAMNGADSSSSNPSGVQGVCPDGWHLPSDAEWTELTDYLAGERISGSTLKEAGTVHWYTPNTGATDSSGFNALPGGTRGSDGAFYHVDLCAYFWSATGLDESNAWGRSLYVGHEDMLRYSYSKERGFSVRCVKD